MRKYISDRVAVAMASTWSERETSKLIDLWGDDVIQAQLEGYKRNREVFEKISRGMASLSPSCLAPHPVP